MTNLDKTLNILAAPLASLFLLLAIVPMITRPKPSGQPVLTTHPCAPDEVQTFNNRSIVVRLMPRGRAMINANEMSQGDLQTKLPLIFSARSDGTLYLEADSNLPFQEVASFIGTARSRTKDLKFELLGSDDALLPCGAPARPIAYLPRTTEP